PLCPPGRTTAFVSLAFGSGGLAKESAKHTGGRVKNVHTPALVSGQSGGSESSPEAYANHDCRQDYQLPQMKSEPPSIGATSPLVFKPHGPDFIFEGRRAYGVRPPWTKLGAGWKSSRGVRLRCDLIANANMDELFGNVGSPNFEYRLRPTGEWA